MLKRQINTTNISTENLAKDYRSCSLYPQMPLRPVPSASVSPRERVIENTARITIPWYLYWLKKLPFNGFLIDKLNIAQKTTLYKVEEEFPIANITLTEVHAAAKSGGGFNYDLWIRKYIVDITNELFSSSYAIQIANMMSDGTENEGYIFQVAIVKMRPMTEREPKEIIK